MQLVNAEKVRNLTRDVERAQHEYTHNNRINPLFTQNDYVPGSTAQSLGEPTLAPKPTTVGCAANADSTIQVINTTNVYIYVYSRCLV